MLGAGESQTPFDTITLRDDRRWPKASDLASARYPISLRGLRKITWPFRLARDFFVIFSPTL